MRKIGALIFPGFELLDLFGPLEMFGMLAEQFTIRIVAETADPIKSYPGPMILPDDLTSDNQDYDILLIPGGDGTRREVDNDGLLQWLWEKSAKAELVASVCTGSALLAKAGLLDARKATTNKEEFDETTSNGPSVHWQKKARWVQDGRFFTSSGVSAGTDMSLAIIAHLHDLATAEQIARWAEYTWNRDPNNDPFFIAP
jgi:putative intracellular protease/amidase